MKTALLVFLPLIAAWSQPLNRPVNGPAVTKEFRYILHYDYVSRLYSPPVVLFPSRPSVPPAPPASLNAEQCLSAITYALRSADYDLYLQLWDGPSRAKISERHLATGVTKAQWVADRQAESTNLRYTLIEWLLKGPYVILRYEVTRLKGDQIVDNQAVAMAFSTREGHWKATLDLEDDLVFRLHGSGKQEIRTVVRP